MSRIKLLFRMALRLLEFVGPFETQPEIWKPGSVAASTAEARSRFHMRRYFSLR